MKKLLLAISLLCSLGYTAQQDALFSQYMFNPFAINPAYAGSRNSLSGVLLARKQWAGFAGAPATGTFAVHSPFKGKNFALGFNAIAEEIGPNINSGAFITYAYHLRLPSGKLSFGLRGGIFSSRLNNNLLRFDDGTDVTNTGGVLKGTTPNFDFGAYYYTQKFYVGLSSSHITAGAINYRGNDLSMNINRHYMLASGLAIVINPDVVIKPSILVKYVQGALINFDINTSVLLKKDFWLGASFRSNSAFNTQSLVGIFEYNITDFMRIGYAYDFAFGKLRNYNSGSHELFIGLDLNVSKKVSVSPRYISRYL